MKEINYKDLEIVVTIAIFRLMHLAERTLDTHPKGYGILTCEGLKDKRLTADKLIIFSQVMTHPAEWNRHVRQEEEQLTALLAGTWKSKFRPTSSVTEEKIREIWAAYTDKPCPEWLLANFR